jgi:hypothetical protein
MLHVYHSSVVSFLSGHSQSRLFTFHVIRLGPTMVWILLSLIGSCVRTFVPSVVTLPYDGINVTLWGLCLAPKTMSCCTNSKRDPFAFY